MPIASAGEADQFVTQDLPSMNNSGKLIVESFKH